MRIKTIMAIVTTVAALIAIATGWSAWDLPRPALNTEIQAVQQYAGSTREIVLNQEWFRLSIQLEQALAKSARDSSNFDLIREVVRLRLALKNVESQLRELQ